MLLTSSIAPTALPSVTSMGRDSSSCGVRIDGRGGVSKQFETDRQSPRSSASSANPHLFYSRLEICDHASRSALAECSCRVDFLDSLCHLHGGHLRLLHIDCNVGEVRLFNRIYQAIGHLLLEDVDVCGNRLEIGKCCVQILLTIVDGAKVDDLTRRDAMQRGDGSNQRQNQRSDAEREERPRMGEGLREERHFPRFGMQGISREAAATWS